MTQQAQRRTRIRAAYIRSAIVGIGFFVAAAAISVTVLDLDAATAVVVGVLGSIGAAVGAWVSYRAVGRSQ